VAATVLERRVFSAAFPASLREAVLSAAALITKGGYYLHAPVRDERHIVTVEGEAVDIVARIYNPELTVEEADTLVGTPREVLDCLYTRHHDGFVRQRHLQRIVQLTHPWVAPFVVQLIGEYVIQILIDIRDGLSELDAEGSTQRLRYGAFVAHNPAFIDLTSQRVMSYWSRGSEPGTSLIASLRAAGAAFEHRAT
jgi:hypothetical protein